MEKFHVSCWLVVLVTTHYVGSYSPRQCDIRFWHMEVMEHIFTQEDKMTSNQLATLEKVDQIMERVQEGASPLIPCALLGTYSQVIVPDISKKLMEQIVAKSDESKMASDPVEDENRSKDETSHSENDSIMSENSDFEGDKTNDNWNSNSVDVNERERDESNDDQSDEVKKDDDETDEHDDNKKHKNTNSGGVVFFFEDDEDEETNGESDENTGELDDKNNHAQRHDDETNENEHNSDTKSEDDSSDDEEEILVFDAFGDLASSKTMHNDDNLNENDNEGLGESNNHDTDSTSSSRDRHIDVFEANKHDGLVIFYDDDEDEDDQEEDNSERTDVRSRYSSDLNGIDITGHGPGCNDGDYDDQGSDVDSEDDTIQNRYEDESHDGSEARKDSSHEIDVVQKTGKEESHNIELSFNKQNIGSSLQTVKHSHRKPSKHTLAIAHQRDCVNKERRPLCYNICVYMHLLLRVCSVPDLYRKNKDEINDKNNMQSRVNDHREQKVTFRYMADLHTEEFSDDSDGSDARLTRELEEKRTLKRKIDDGDVNDDEDMEVSKRHSNVGADSTTSAKSIYNVGGEHDEYKRKDKYTASNSAVDLEKLELLLGKHESQQAARIQDLELMLVKLENKVLSQSLDKQTDTQAFSSLENQILRLENELLKLNQSYHKLQEDHESLRSRREQYLSELQVGEGQPKPKYLALPDNSSRELMTQQQARITELTWMVKNQSDLVRKIQTKSDQLEEQNRKLFQVVMNQTALISHIMGKLQELSEEGMQAKIQAEEFKSKLDKLKDTQTSGSFSQQSSLGHMTPQGKASPTYDYATVSSTTHNRDTSVKDLATAILKIMTSLPSANFPSMKLADSWKCGGLNSTRLCIFHTLTISNCTPFNAIYWRLCKPISGSIILSVSLNSDSANDSASYDASPPMEIRQSISEKKMTDRLSVGEEGPKGGIASAESEQHSVHNSDLELEEIDKSKPSIHRDMGDNVADSTAIRQQETESDDKTTVQSDSENKKLLNILPSSSGKNLITKTTDGIPDSSIISRSDNVIQGVIKSDNKNKIDRHEPAVGKKSGVGDDQENVIKSKRTDKTIEEDPNVKSSLGGEVPSGQIAEPQNEMKPKEKNICQAGDKSPQCQDEARHTAAPPATDPQGKTEQTNADSQNSRNASTTKEQQEAKATEAKERKEAALEAKALHEALHRRVLYEPMNNQRPKDCYDLYKKGQQRSGMNQVYVNGLDVYVSVYCDMENSGWTLLLRREDGSLDFYQSYEQYKDGFGTPRGEHYIGNDVVHHMTNQGHYSLRVELSDWEGNIRHASYDHFWIDGEEDSFELHILGYSGTAGDGLSKHNGMKFSTFDVDHDLLKTEMGGSCAKRFHGAGWYYKCYASNIMGRYYQSSSIPDKLFDGVAWKPWHGPAYSLRTATLAIRPFGVDR